MSPIPLLDQPSTSSSHKYTYEPIETFFNVTSWADDIKGPFGLVNTYDWTSFALAIKELNDQCLPDESVKVIYAARHGQAEHNILGEKYGVDIDQAQILHPILDPSLTPLGREQALHLSSALQREYERGMPLPQQWVVSPLMRTGQTVGLEWSWTVDEQGQKEGDEGMGVPAIVVENIREHLHVHLCDSRLPLSSLRSHFPSFTYSPSMTEDDILWQPGSIRGRESEKEMTDRLRKGIDEVISLSEGSTYINLTSHSGALRALFAVLGYKARPLGVGEMNILVIRVKEISPFTRSSESILPPTPTSLLTGPMKRSQPVIMDKDKEQKTATGR